MPGWLKVYGLGDKGVNVSADPLHTEVGDVTHAQNASFSGSGQRGGLAARLGMRQLTTSALHGAVYALLSVTLADPSAGQILTDSDLAILTDEAFLVLVE